MRDKHALDRKVEQRPERRTKIVVGLLAEPPLGTEPERVPGGTRLGARPEDHVSHDDRAVLGEPVDDLRRACCLERDDPAGQLVAGAERMSDLDAAVTQGLRRAGRRPDLARSELTARAPVPVNGDEHVIRLADLARRIDRVDQDQAVRRFHSECADVLFPVVMPRRPTVNARCDLLHQVIFPLTRS